MINMDQDIDIYDLEEENETNDLFSQLTPTPKDINKLDYEFTEEDLITYDKLLQISSRRGYNTLIKMCRKRVRQDWDLIIAFTGETGSGKSTLAVQFGEDTDDGFNYTKNISFLPDEAEVHQRFNSVNRYGFYLIDEAVAVLHKHHWYDKMQQSINELYDLERRQNKITGLCIPRFRNLTENFRNYKVKLHVNVLCRGLAVVRLIDPDQDIKDPWHLDQNIKMKDKFFKNDKVGEIYISRRLTIERSMPNYLCDFVFKDLPPVKKELYRQLKDESRIDYLKKLSKIHSRISDGN